MNHRDLDEHETPEAVDPDVPRKRRRCTARTAIVTQRFRVVGSTAPHDSLGAES